MSEWCERVLGDVLEIKHGYPFKGAAFSQGGAHRLVTPGNFYERGGFRDRGPSQKSYDGQVPHEFILPPDSLVVAMTEQAPGLLGSSGLVPRDGNVWLHNQRIGLVRIRDRAANQRFLYYLFNDPSVRAQINATATGTKVRHTAPRRIQAVRARLPDAGTQRRIAAVLSAFDELIEINERRIELLEDLARSLYREWFVRFRFPGHEDVELVDSELGPIPDGWEVRQLGGLCSLVSSGRTPRRSDPTNWVCGAIPWFKTGELQDGPLIAATEHVTSTSGAKMFEPPAIFMAIYGSPTVGRLGWVTQTCSCNQAALALRTEDPERQQDWLWHQLWSLRDHFNSMSQGAAQQNISKEKVVGTSVALPPGDLLQGFAGSVGPSRRLSHELASANRQLAATRDLLLPRLVTGRLDISDVDLGDLLPPEAA